MNVSPEGSHAAALFVRLRPAHRQASSPSSPNISYHQATNHGAAPKRLRPESKIVASLARRIGELVLRKVEETGLFHCQGERPMKQIARLLAHMEWANQRVLDLLKQLPEIPDRPRNLFSHLLIAERLWMLRLRNEDTSGADVWPDYSLAELDQLANANQAGYRMFLEKIDEAGGLDEPVSYRTTTGEDHTTKVRDILTHVALHGAYHRGQIAAVLREAEFEPVNTDFVNFVRQ